MEDAQFQRDTVAPEFERVVHLLHDEFRMVKHFQHHAVGPAAELDCAWRRLYPGCVQEFHRGARFAPDSIGVVAVVLVGVGPPCSW